MVPASAPRWDAMKNTREYQGRGGHSWAKGMRWEMFFLWFWHAVTPIKVHQQGRPKWWIHQKHHDVQTHLGSCGCVFCLIVDSDSTTHFVLCDWFEFGWREWKRTDGNQLTISSGKQWWIWLLVAITGCPSDFRWHIWCEFGLANVGWWCCDFGLFLWGSQSHVFVFVDVVACRCARAWIGSMCSCSNALVAGGPFANVLVTCDWLSRCLIANMAQWEGDSQRVRGCAHYLQVSLLRGYAWAL